MGAVNTTANERNAARNAAAGRTSPKPGRSSPVPRSTFASPTIAEQLQSMQKRAPIKQFDTLGAPPEGRNLTRSATASNKSIVEIDHEDPTLIDRRTSKRMPYWDIAMIFSLLFAATVTPYEVTYLSEGPCVTPLFIVNRFIDLFFVIDILVTFNLVEQDAKTGRWLYTRQKIRRKYLSTWFCIDIVSGPLLHALVPPPLASRNAPRALNVY